MNQKSLLLYPHLITIKFLFKEQSANQHTYIYAAFHYKIQQAKSLHNWIYKNYTHPVTHHSRTVCVCLSAIPHINTLSHPLSLSLFLSFPCTMLIQSPNLHLILRISIYLLWPFHQKLLPVFSPWILLDLPHPVSSFLCNNNFQPFSFLTSWASQREPSHF